VRRGRRGEGGREGRPHQGRAGHPGEEVHQNSRTLVSRVSVIVYLIVVSCQWSASWTTSRRPTVIVRVLGPVHSCLAVSGLPTAFLPPRQSISGYAVPQTWQLR